MKIAICDDDKQELIKINAIIDEYLRYDFVNDKIEVRSFESSIELIEQLESGKQFDVFLLDVIMPGLNGIELAAEIRNKDQVAKIIFLTSSPEFAVESYSVNAFNYLLKPIQKDKLFSVLEKVRSDIFTSKQKYITVKTQTGMFKIFMDELIYIEVMGRNIFFHQTNGVVTEGICTISQVQTVLLTDKRFIKPHRSYIVNMDFIKTLERDGFITLSNQFIPVSRNIYKEVKQAFFEYLS